MTLFDKVTKVLHKVRIKLYPCQLPGKKELYIARIDNEAVLSIEEVCAALIERGVFTGDYATLVRDVKLFLDEVARQLCDGFGVSTRYFSLHPVVAGYFRGITEALDRKAHPVSFRFHVLPLLRALADLITIEASYAKTDGYIDTFTDFESQPANQDNDKNNNNDNNNDNKTPARNTLTPGGLFMASGHKVKISGNNPKNGVWFIPVTDPGRRVKAEGGFAENQINKIIGKIPDLAPGAYTLEIVTQFSGGGKLLQEPRTIIFPEELTVPDEERPAVSTNIERDLGA
ncbi:MAG: DUF4469 domain-containing protein [Spirochaetaceae bacterium]|jgi:hypothetical protein|nr:DUF4469 domain-containing protein [Spirochaetaceae bacterium]